MDLTFLAQADRLTLDLELARAALESAKNNLDLAKQAYDEILAQADARGIPRAKLRKLTEDRVQALLESGILTVVGGGEADRSAGGEARRERSRKAPRKIEGESATGAALSEEDGTAALQNNSGAADSPSLSLPQ